MKLYHATKTKLVPQILREGLQPQFNVPQFDPVHLHERDTSEFVFSLYGMEPGGYWEFHYGRDTVTLLEVDVTGLELETPGWDGEGHHMSWKPISPDRITVLSEYTGVNAAV